MALEAIINQKDAYRIVLEEYPEGVYVLVYPNFRSSTIQSALAIAPGPILVESLHYIDTCSKCFGRVIPSRWSRIAWCSVGLATHRLRTSNPQRVGSTTSTV